MAGYTPTMLPKEEEMVSLETSRPVSVELSSLGRLAQSYMSDGEEET